MTDMNFASLSPALLARKGGAKPAMRRQSPMVTNAVTGAHPSQPGMSEAALEDLGWNDLGEPDRSPAKTAQSEPQHTAHAAPAQHANDVGDEADDTCAKDDFAPLASHAQSTATERDEVAENVTPIRKPAPRLPRSQTTRPSAPKGAPHTASSGKRTAFTLRLDAERHLKLRLACTLAGRSAQALVTEAVDAMFATTPELDALVARVQSRPQQEG
ncbi:hypothetical protein AAG612_06085 [Citromicrobium bathyomarinum]|uniref:hypothetical protein n=1 Tax=Citromicrobium bathyomarinum TaxID=72174 RepID=UPI00315A724D